VTRRVGLLLGILGFMFLAGCGGQFIAIVPTATPLPTATPTPSATPTQTPNLQRTVDVAIQMTGTTVAETAIAALEQVNTWATVAAETNAAAADSLYTMAAALNATETELARPTETATASPTPTATLTPTPLPNYIATVTQMYADFVSLAQTNIAQSAAATSDALQETVQAVQATQTVMARPTITPTRLATLPPPEAFITITAYALAATASEEYRATLQAQTAVATTLSSVTLPDLAIRLAVPPGFGEPQRQNARTVILENRATPAASITLARGTTDDVLNGVYESRRPPAESLGDPVAVLRSAVTVPADTPTDVILLDNVAEYTGLNFPAARVRLQVPGITGESLVVLLRLGEDDWLTLVFSGPPEVFTAWLDDTLRSITRLPDATPTPLPTPTPTAWPTFTPTLTPTVQLPPTIELTPTLQLIEEQAGVALGLDFDVPTGWMVSELSPGEPFQTPAIQIVWIGATRNENRITILRGSEAQLAELDFPAGESDPAMALRAIALAVREEHGLNSGGRAESIQIGDFTGAWASLRGDALTLRLYLLSIAPDDWVLILAEGPRDTFNTFNQNELRQVLSSLRLASGESAGPMLPPPGPMEEARVLEVTDGDTIVVEIDGREERVRYIGVNTPETHHPTIGAEWMGYEATHFNAAFVHVGDTVLLESDVTDRDIYGRLLRYVWVTGQNGERVMVNAELLRAGMAQTSTYDERRYLTYFLALERAAQEANLGRWGDPPPPPPVEPLAEVGDLVWAHNPDDDTVPLLYDAAALGLVPNPIAEWPNDVPTTVRDVFYVYAEERYWYWLEINQFRGWVPEDWILTAEPPHPAAPPQTRIIAYDFVTAAGDAPLDVYNTPHGDAIAGQIPPGVEFQVTRLSIARVDGSWWLYTDRTGPDGWIPLEMVRRVRPG